MALGRTFLATVAVAAAMLALAAAGASAATFTVACSNGVGSPSDLNAAVTSANSTTTADTIEITGTPCTFTYTAVGGPGAAGSGNDNALPIITNPLTINGHGAKIQRSSASGTPNFRLLLGNNTAVTLNDLTFSGGNLAGTNVGGGVAQFLGSMTLNNVVIISNTVANGNGGGFWAQGATVTMDKVVSQGNVTSAGGGGAAILGGTATIDHSSFLFNSAGNGGGIYAVAPVAGTVVRRSAFVLNAATGSTAGALVQGGNVKFENDTFASNVAANGLGGIAVDNNNTTQGTATIESVTFADSSKTGQGTAPANSIFTCVGATGSACGSGTAPVVHVHNTIVTDTDSTAAAVTAPCASAGGSIVDDGGNLEWPTTTCPGNWIHADPQLIKPGGNNGGQTFNYAIPVTSPAFDHGTSPCPATDQRDMPRPAGAACDIGAYEQQDLTLPDTVIDSGPSGATGDNTPTFTFHSTETGSTFQCAVDAGAFASCTSPRTTAALSDGPHTFRVRAIDAAGNVDDSPATRDFTVDTSAPDTVIDSGPTGPTKDSTPTFTFHSTESGSTFKCAVDNGAFTSCTSPHTTAALSDGQHTFKVQATDAQGNVDPTPATQTFTVDTVAPDTTLDSGPPSFTNDSTPTFTFHSNDPDAKFFCSIDNGTFFPCATPFTPSPLADGLHVFKVSAVDPAGNADLSPASQTFVVDTAAPDTVIDSGPSGLTNDATPTFTFHSTESNSTFQCAIDDGAFASCTSPYTTDALSDGEHTFRVRAIDRAGNVDAAPATRTFTVDTTPPETTITSGPTGLWAPGKTNDSTPTFTFDSSESGSTFECSVDGGPWQSCSSPYTTPQLPDGQHSFRVRATDPAGNTDPTPAESTFTIEPSCSLVRIVIDLFGQPHVVCLVEERAPEGNTASASAATEPAFAWYRLSVTRRGQVFATAKVTGTKRPQLRVKRTMRAGYYVIKVVARAKDGKTYTGRLSIRVTKAQAHRFGRKRHRS
jgi:hypothetical protein